MLPGPLRGEELKRILFAEKLMRKLQICKDYFSSSNGTHFTWRVVRPNHPFTILALLYPSLAETEET